MISIYFILNRYTVGLLLSSLTGDAYIGMPLDFRVRVEVLRSPNRFSCDEVIDDWRDLENKSRRSITLLNTYIKLCHE